MPDNKSPTENGLQFYRQRSLAYQALCEQLLARLKETTAVIEGSISAIRAVDEQFSVKVDDPMQALLANVRQSRPDLADISDEELMKTLATNPGILNQ